MLRATSRGVQKITSIDNSVTLTPTDGKGSVDLSVSGSGSGTVTSVGLSTNASWLTVGSSPITHSGTITLNATTGLTANEFLATPNGSSGAVGLRAIVAADIPTLNQNTTGSASSLSISGQTGLMTVTGLASTNRTKTVRDAADTILELGGSYTPTGTWTSMTLVTPALGTPASGVLTNCTGTASGLTAGNVTTNANLTGAVTSSGNATTLVGSVPFSAPSTVAVGNATIYLMTKAAFGGTINSIQGAQTTSGSITLAIKINGTAVTGLSAISVTSTPGDTSASGGNTFAAGDIITAVTSGASSDLGLSFNLKITRT